MKKYFFTMLSMAVLFTGVPPAFAANYVNPDVLKQWLTSGKHLIIVDIQPADDFEEQHFEGAVETNAFPVKTDEEKQRLDRALTKIKASKSTVVVVCPRGKTGASNAYEHLKSKGIPEARLFILEGGIADWPYKDLFVKGRQ